MAVHTLRAAIQDQACDCHMAWRGICGSSSLLLWRRAREKDAPPRMETNSDWTKGIGQGRKKGYMAYSTFFFRTTMNVPGRPGLRGFLTFIADLLTDRQHCCRNASTNDPRVTVHHYGLLIGDLPFSFRRLF
jgi:hypothetical protein